ncbi:MAG TPA: 30S ribosomal protein S6 [Myxococcota bacterium]|nr:30S ribosomal protein S6 [Myxococcota bacterium]HRY94262.1 30S ribosomal protein S6 [Myxococcota bacterium]HSA20959.1 30S ribosomal protein S6 [Myxococcota bacterium]
MAGVREYETLYILRPDLTDEAAVQINDRLKGVLERDGARLLKCNLWGKRKTAFEVKKHPKGIYVQMCYLSQPAFVGEFERNLRMIEPVIRYQTIKLAEDVDIEKRVAEQEATDRAQAEAEAKARAEAEARKAAGLSEEPPAPPSHENDDDADDRGYGDRRGRGRRDRDDDDLGGERDLRHKDEE